MHLNISRVAPWDIPDDEIFDGGNDVSPYSELPLTTETMSRFPISITMCFNDTADISPSFKLTFPNAARPIFYAFVCDWDIGGSLKDATQYEFEDGDFKTPVNLWLPNDRQTLLAMQMEVVDRFWRYPDVAVEL